MIYSLHTIKTKDYAKQRQGHDSSLQIQQGGKHQFEANRQHWNKNNGDKLDINKFRLEIRNGSNHQSGEILEEHRDGKGGRKKRPEPTKAVPPRKELSWLCSCQGQCWDLLPSYVLV